MTVDQIEFTPIKPQNGHIGFVAFIIDDWLFCSSIAVYTRPDGGIRLVWPTIRYKDRNLSTCYPRDGTKSQEIEKAVQSKIDELYKSLSP